MKIIEVRNLAYTYQPESPLAVTALRGITFSVEEGEFVGIIGQTGSGKSTLVQHLNGLIRPAPGQVLIEGVDLGAKGTDLRAIRSKVGLVFQYPENQIFEETVAADIAFGPRNLKLPEEEIERRVREAMELVGLDYQALAGRSPAELSGGQLRRVAIAGVLAMRPKILVLDEPTAGLDPRGRDEILARIRALHDSLRLTTILVSHNMEEVARLVDRLLVLHEGRLILEGPPGWVFSQVEELHRLGLGVPQVTQVLHGLKERGWPVHTEATDVPGAARCILEAWRKRTCSKT